MRAVCFFHRAIEYFNGIIPILNNISKLWALNTLTIEWPNWLTKNTIHSRQKKRINGAVTKMTMAISLSTSKIDSHLYGQCWTASIRYFTNNILPGIELHSSINIHKCFRTVHGSFSPSCCVFVYFPVKILHSFIIQ